MRKYLILLFLLIPCAVFGIGISYEDETSYTSMRGSFYDGQSWWGGEVLGSSIITGTNSDFSGVGDWNNNATNSTVTINYDSGDAGHTSCMRIEAGDASFERAGITKGSLTAGTVYKVEFDYKYINSTGRTVAYDKLIRIYSGSNHDFDADFTVTGNWEKFTGYFTAALTQTMVMLIYANEDNGHADNEILIDSITVKPVTSLNTQSGTVSNGDLLVVDDSAGKKAYGYIKKDAYTNETLGSNLFDQDGGAGGTGDKGAFTLADLRLAELNSGTLTVGTMYEISAQDDADFTTDGAPDNVVGTTFIATGTNVTLDAGDKVYPVDISWTPAASNLVDIDGNALHVTYVNSQYGAQLFINTASDFTSGTTIKKLYKLTGIVKVNTGSVIVRFFYSASDYSFITVISTDFIPFELYLTSANENSLSISIYNMGAGEEIWFDNLKLYEVTAPAINAVQVYKEKGLVNQGWFQIDASFNYNKDSAFDFDVYRHPGAKQNW